MPADDPRYTSVEWRRLRVIARDDLFVAYADRRPSERLFITVNRVAKDGSWADITVQTWAVMWKKRQKLRNGIPPDSVRKWWDQDDLDEQEADHVVKFRLAPNDRSGMMEHGD